MNAVVSESLQIVGDELAVTLNEARVALEQFAEGEGGPNILDRCVNMLHTVRGVLRMTETYGASLLAEEMEATCLYLARTRDQASDEAIESLSRAAVQLPAYVERILQGGRDIPLVLLPLLNDLRAARGKPLLSESTLLLLNVFGSEDDGPVLPAFEPSGEDLADLCHKLRPRFQLALLGLIKGEGPERSLVQIAEILGRLERASSRPEGRKLWWVAAGIAESLRDGKLETSVSLKRLMGQVDREIKRLHSIGEERFAAQPPRELINNLLYYVARVTEPNPRVLEIRDAFNLGELVPATEQVEAVRESLAAPSMKLMHTVAEAIREDLARVKDVLDIYLRTGMAHPEELVPQVELLKKIGDTLGVLGLGELREVVQTRREELDEIASGQGQAEEGRLVSMAAALISVEQQLGDQLLKLITPPDDAVQAAPSEDAEYVEVTRAVMRECVVNLSRVQDAITQVLGRPGDGTPLDTVPPLLRGINAGLLILGKTEAVELVEDTEGAIRRLVQQEAGAPDKASLDLLADAIISLHYYMETLEAGRREPTYMLNNARRCLLALSELPPAIPEFGEVSTGMATTLQIAEPSATVEALDPRALASLPGMGKAEERPDPEIIELFIEEAGEEIESIQGNYTAWAEDDSNEDALSTMRRSFHTLKGSGRMVGASLIGEFAWSIENLLNRVINKTIDTSPAIVELMGEVVASLPQLLEQLETGEPVQADIEGLVDRAGILAKGTPVTPVETPAPEAPVEETATEERAGEEAFEPVSEEAVEDTPIEAAEPAMADETPYAPAVESDAETDDSLVEEIAREPVASHHDDMAAEAKEPAEPEVSEGVERADETGTVHDISAIEELKTAEFEALFPETEETAEDTPAEAVEADGIDPVLLDILEKEVGGHLEVVRAFVDDCRNGTPPYVVGEPLYRACHTLHGSVTMAQASHAETLTAPLNQMIRHAFDHQVPVGDRVVDACADARGALTEVIDALVARSAEMPDTDALAARLWALSEEIEQSAAAAAEAEAPEAEVEQVAEAPAEVAEAAPSFDPEIAAIFAEEADEILDGADAALPRLAADASRAAALEELQRSLHTLKGGARMAGLTAMGNLSHDLEALTIGLSSGRIEADQSALDLTQAVIDELHRMRERVVAGQAPDAPAELVDRLSLALSGEAAEPVIEDHEATQQVELPEGVSEPEGSAVEEPAEPEVPPADVEEDVSVTAAPETGEAVLPGSEQIGELAEALRAPAQPEEGTAFPGLFPPAREPAAPERREFARVDPELLQQLLNGAGEISIFHSRLMQQTSQIQFNVEELGQTVTRLRDQLRSLEMATEAQILYLHQGDMAQDDSFDPLELDRYSRIQQLSRALAETASDVNSLKDLLQQLAADSETLLVQQSRTANELQDGLMRTRMVPFQQQGTRLARLVRQTAAETGKQAELHLEGGGELDRQVLEKMLPPFEHMLRNAVVHGLETPEERQSAGKPATGRVEILLRREGSEVVIEVRDDGRGLNVDAIRAKAIELGVMDPTAEVTDQEAMQFIMRPGFTTAGELTQSAGRGIGMDVVASEIAKLGGTLRMTSEAGVGTEFTVRLPFTLAVTQALIVRTGAELYALPLPTVEGIIRVDRDEFEAHMNAEDPAIDYGGQRYQFRHLGQFVGTGPSRIVEDEERISIILVRAGENSTALITDEMIDSREIVVKPVGAQLATIRGISGATILGDGRVVVILDAGALVRSSRPPLEPVAPPQEEERAEPVALVVDDSITMRRVTKRLLERNDFHVLTAKDGVEAVGVLQEHIPDIILLDVEMPRMDGYEFATHVRNNVQTQDLPIIMITSRVSEKHRAKAIEIGVNDYLGKPYQEQALMDAVRELLQLPAEV
jgi:chemosensory pili system protein ChpA (sensor histidine kinase/response regulator)